MAASQNGHTETVKLLLNRGAEVDLPDNVRNSNHASGMCSHETRTELDHGRVKYKYLSCSISKK